MTDAYAASGVDVSREEPALERLKRWAGQTHGFRPELGLLAGGLSSFASVLEVGGVRLALATDGVGSKLLVAQLAERYDTIGIDCVAMNVNDIVAVGAEPLAMLDYLAIEQPDPDVFEAIGRGLFAGARDAGVALVGGETSQIGEMLRGVRPGSGFDLVGMCLGRVLGDQPVTGALVRPGDVVIGLTSSGIHSNGLTLARKVLLAEGADGHAVEPTLGRSALAELLEPTRIYVRQALALLRSPRVQVHALAHITGDGFANLSRVEAPVGFELDALPAPPPVFGLIAERGDVPPAEMYTTFNMGIGFCVVVPETSVDAALNVLASHSEQGLVIGRATESGDRRVCLPGQGLVSEGRRFVAD